MRSLRQQKARRKLLVRWKGRRKVGDGSKSRLQRCGPRNWLKTNMILNTIVTFKSIMKQKAKESSKEELREKVLGISLSWTRKLNGWRQPSNDRDRRIWLLVDRKWMKKNSLLLRIHFSIYPMINLTLKD